MEFADNSSFAELIQSIVEQYSDAVAYHSVNEALEHAIYLAKMCNLQIEVSSPWKLAKESNNESLDRLLYALTESLRIIAILISPVMPRSGAWNFQSTQLEDGVERKGRTVLSRRCGVGKIAGWSRSRQANAAVSAD